MPGNATRKKAAFLLTLILLFNFSTKLLVADYDYLSPWDEAFHALVAKNFLAHPFKPVLMENPVYGGNPNNWMISHIWLHKPPVSLWAISLGMKVFGMREVYIRLPSIILNTLTVFLVFLIARSIGGDAAGLSAALIASFNSVFLRLSTGIWCCDHPDTFLVFFTTLSFYFILSYIRDNSGLNAVLVGFSAGLGFLSKWFPALLPVLAFAILIIRERKSGDSGYRDLAYMLAAFFFTVLPWCIHAYLLAPDVFIHEQAYSLKHVTSAVEEHTEPFYFYLRRLYVDFGFGWGSGIIDILNLVFFYAVFGYCLLNFQKKTCLRRGFRLVFYAWIFVPLIIFSFTQTKMRGYTAIAYPGICIILGLCISNFMASSLKTRKMRVSSMLLLVLLALFLTVSGMNYLKLVGDGIDRIDDRCHSTPAFKGNVSLIEETHPNNTLVLNTGSPAHIYTMFYTGIPTYDKSPDEETIARMMRMRLNVLIAYRPGGETSPESRYDHENITYIPFACAHG